jgi:hypothetical protein
MARRKGRTRTLKKALELRLEEVTALRRFGLEWHGVAAYFEADPDMGGFSARTWIETWSRMQKRLRPLDEVRVRSALESLKSSWLAPLPLTMRICAPAEQSAPFPPSEAPPATLPAGPKPVCRGLDQTGSPVSPAPSNPADRARARLEAEERPTAEDLEALRVDPESEVGILFKRKPGPFEARFEEIVWSLDPVSNRRDLEQVVRTQNGTRHGRIASLRLERLEIGRGEVEAVLAREAEALEQKQNH